MLRPALIAALALCATPALAQDFLRGLARSTAEAAARRAVDRALTQAQPARPARTADPQVARTSAAGGAPARTDGVSAVPRPADAAERKKALEQFSRYRCDACEGGWAYDSWATHGLNLVGNNLLATKMGSLAVGQSVAWKGRAANGQGIVTADVEKAGLPCKQVTWRMTKGQETAEREGLFCQVLMGNAPGVPTWLEVY